MSVLLTMFASIIISCLHSVRQRGAESWSILLSLFVVDWKVLLELMFVHASKYVIYSCKQYTHMTSAKCVVKC